MALVGPCVDVQERGILVNEELRQERLRDLGLRLGALGQDLDTLITPILEEHQDHERFKLFEDVWTCPCCRNGRVKRAACWSCAGFESKPSKKTLGDVVLHRCKECVGLGQTTSVGLNPNSPEQLKILLYEFLKLPPRYADGKLSSTTEKIRSLLPYA
jgi:hypothetical protein